jgi:ADP-heptose:LPS heptosyltransferase
MKLGPELNILLIRLKSMGDVLFTLPAVHLLRETFPRARITFLVSAENAPLLEGFQGVDETIAVDRARFRGGNPVHIGTETFGLLRRLRPGRFSLVVDFQGYGETAWLARLSRARQRWACVHKTLRSWAYTHSLRWNKRMHPIDCYLSLLHQCGIGPRPVRNRFVLPDKALREARRFFAAHGLIPDRPALFVQPFTSTPNKCWPLDRYCALARHWRARGRQVLFGGGPGDRAALEPAQQEGFAVSAGAPLLVSAGLAKLCTVMVGGDTGLLHLAAAMGKRVAAIIRGDTPGNKYPYLHPEWAITPATGSDIATIGVETVMAACERALAETILGGMSAGAH